MTPCQKLGYKVGDEFVTLEAGCGFVKGQNVKLYFDDGSHAPKFQGCNSLYNLCDGMEGAYLNLESITKTVKEEKEEMKFDMKKEPWFVRVANEQEYNAARDWVKENTGYNLGTSYFEGIAAISNTDDAGDVYTRVMWCPVSRRHNITCHEIKLTFKTIIDSVTFPEVKTEQQKQIEELEKTILLAKQQIEQLKNS